MLKYEIFCFWDFYILLSKLQKNYTYAGEVLYVYGWQILSDFTYAGEVLYVCWRFTYAGEVLYVCWRFTYAGVLRLLALQRTVGQEWAKVRQKRDLVIETKIILSCSKQRLQPFEHIWAIFLLEINFKWVIFLQKDRFLLIIGTQCVKCNIAFF